MRKIVSFGVIIVVIVLFSGSVYAITDTNVIASRIKADPEKAVNIVESAICADPGDAGAIVAVAAKEAPEQIIDIVDVAVRCAPKQKSTILSVTTLEFPELASKIKKVAERASKLAEERLPLPSVSSAEVSKVSGGVISEVVEISPPSETSNVSGGGGGIASPSTP